ncbi:MAG TPA: 16S rRNA (adenine(1518)-N(6)/adenine(1519)-N(6))-dimethyltransferase RsmA, partial [Rhizobiales bacterium]|nr:16S rRNA (adenine(1518)-N(6)/adenine(1519)-N(6))-dimethyltransferase RsmA [Hyphomicrobiales bacterium]
GLPPLRDVIAQHQLSAKKNLGQNFLLDLNLTGKIARAAGELADHTIIEIGPGPGGLTRGLLMEGAKKVIAIERDERVLPALAQIASAYPDRLDVISADAMQIDWAGIVDGPTKIVANLPYNIATPLLVGWLTTDPWPPWFNSLTLMFQKEVAERIVAPTGSKTYGRLSVLSQWRADAQKLFDVPARAFTPPPKVTSSIVHITPHQNPGFDCDIAALEKVSKAAFGQRRKMLRASLKSILPNPQEVLENAGINPTLRAEQLEIKDFCRLANLL